MSSDSDNDDGKRARSRKQDDGSLLKEIRAQIQSSEVRTEDRIDKKIDLKVNTLSDRVTNRLDTTEKDVKNMGRIVKELKGEVVSLTSQAELDCAELPVLVERLVADKVATFQAARAEAPLRTPPGKSANKAEKYDHARRSLRLWPLMDLSEDVVKDFLVSKLAMDQGEADNMFFRTKRL